MIKKLMDRAASSNVHFCGIAVIPGEDVDGSDALIWVAMVSGDPSGSDRYLQLPDKNDSVAVQATYIIDHSKKMPKFLRLHKKLSTIMGKLDGKLASHS